MNIIYDLEDIQEVATDLIKVAYHNKIWLFYGDMGVGKTTLISEIIKQITAQKNIVPSPTFSLINSYKGRLGEVHHFDLYRIQSLKELIDIGFEDYIYGIFDLICIEWPNLSESLLPKEVVRIYIKQQSDCKRVLTIK